MFAVTRQPAHTTQEEAQVFITQCYAAIQTLSCVGQGLRKGFASVHKDEGLQDQPKFVVVVSLLPLDAAGVVLGVDSRLGLLTGEVTGLLGVVTAVAGTVVLLS